METRAKRREPYGIYIASHKEVSFWRDWLVLFFYSSSIFIIQAVVFRLNFRNGEYIFDDMFIAWFFADAFYDSLFLTIILRLTLRKGLPLFKSIGVFFIAAAISGGLAIFNLVGTAGSHYGLLVKSSVPTALGISASLFNPFTFFAIIATIVLTITAHRKASSGP